MPSQRVQRIVEEKHIPLYEEAVSTLEAAIDLGKNLDNNWMFTAFFDPEYSFSQIKEAFRLAEKMAGELEQEILVEEVSDQEWQKKMEYDFKPLEVGPFFIHSFDEKVPEGMISLHVPAGLAFGTGEHPTTSGCLSLYDQISAEKEFKNGLDMGCGSAILAMASVKADGVPFLAVDIDEPSIDAARRNVKNNGCLDSVICVCGDGFSAPEVAQKAPYDLVFANILANPLMEMAPHLVKFLQNEGVVILSGFMEAQKKDVYKAYEKQGLKLLSEAQSGEWMAASFVK